MVEVERSPTECSALSEQTLDVLLITRIDIAVPGETARPA
jgi:hypothetical protein